MFPDVDRLIDQGTFVDARILLDEALRLARDSLAQGEVNYRLGYCAYRLNDLNDAERYLPVSRDLLQIEEGSLYPALQRMLKEGWVKARWTMSDISSRTCSV